MTYIIATMTYIIEKSLMLQTMLKMQLKETPHRGLTHVAQYTPSYVFDILIGNEPGLPRHLQKHLVHGFKVRRYSHRYDVFKSSPSCVNCGVTGTIMCLDTNNTDRKYNRAHFNLYGITDSGRVEMLTKDHIVPVSKGGLDELDNYQTMCNTCNERKGAE